jgi:cell division protein FtsI/penicillin-binding protein 2
MTAPGAASTASSSAWRPILRRRLAVVAGAIALWVAGIEARLVYLQVFENADLVARAERQHERTQSAPAKRGDILDRRGRVLATSVDADTIYAVPSEIDNAGDAVKKLCDALGDCTAKDRQGLVERLGTRRAFATSAARSRGSGQARRHAQPRWHRLHRRASASTRTRSWPRTCSDGSGSTTRG